MRTRKIYNEGNLFEFFLIDVQMGACLRTSRIKQAISSVQLYIQRCILGLEKSQGVSSSSINLDRWSWMQKYRVWEASRNVFLYPENWLDPTLRDDKSEAFRTLEETLLQTDLNKSNVDDLIRSYLYNANSTADLDVQAYVWDKTSIIAGTFHLFARTRTAPWNYYYRSVEISSDTRPKVFWQPWSTVEVEIPSIETDGDGSTLAIPGSYMVPAVFNRRLILFLPRLTLKQVDSNSGIGPTKTFQQMSNDPVRSFSPIKYWQISMGWTELRNGRWSPKQVASSSLMAQGAPVGDSSRSLPPGVLAEAQKFPSVTSFRFTVQTRPVTVEGVASTILIVDVDRCYGPVNGNYYNYNHGRYELRGQNLVLGDPSWSGFQKKTSYCNTVPTTFGKQAMRFTTGSESNPIYPHLVEGVYGPPLYGNGSILGPRETRWTISFDESRYNRITAYALDVVTMNDNYSFFTYPFQPSPESKPINYDFMQNSLATPLLESATMLSSIDQVFRVLGGVSAGSQSLAFGKRNGPWHELSNPNALYNWELGVHVIMLLMERLQATQQFDLAISVARLVFDPTVDGTTMDRC